MIVFTQSSTDIPAVFRTRSLTELGLGVHRAPDPVLGPPRSSPSSAIQQSSMVPQCERSWNKGKAGREVGEGSREEVKAERELRGQDGERHRSRGNSMSQGTEAQAPGACWSGLGGRRPS